MTKEQYLEIETKYDASNINRKDFNAFIKEMNPDSFLFVEGTDVYFVKSHDEFLRYRMAANNTDNKRSELTFKKKSTDKNNNVRTEVNLRIDLNDPKLVSAFCEGLGYQKNFSIFKSCDIYYFPDANIVYYTVVPDEGKPATYVEIEASEDIGLTQEEAWQVVQKYEKILFPLGISHQKRLKRSLFEMYRCGF